MTLKLNAAEAAAVHSQSNQALATAMRILVAAGELLGAKRLVPIVSSHIDGCLYHGDSGTEFAEMLVTQNAQVAVPTTLNVGAIDLRTPERIKLNAHKHSMALRLMRAHEKMGCKPTWTCCPYQAGHRPEVGADVAWGESNAVAFCNSVLGARTNRYGDFLDIACAIAGKAPEYGLHLTTNRRATIFINTEQISADLKDQDVFWPVFGAWVGKTFGDEVTVIDGLQNAASEDRLKALGAAAASFGAVALFHVLGVTPEAQRFEDISSEDELTTRIYLTPAMLRSARDLLSTSASIEIDAIGIGSPHLSIDEFEVLERQLRGRKLKLPFYANTGRHTLQQLETKKKLKPLQDLGVEIVVDTCIVVTPILPIKDGVLLTNSGKFAHYAPGNIGYQVVYASLAECVETAVCGTLARDESIWA